jgi:lipopolysaccharide export system protein LptA
MTRRLAPALVTVSLLATGGTLLAQQSGISGGGVSALKGHNTNAPVDVAAERIELQDRADRALLSGNVHITQGDMTLDAARVTVAYTRGSQTEIQRLDANGNVVVTSPSETARGDFGIYDLNKRLITMLGNVRLNQRGNQVNGSRLVIDLNSGRATVDGNGVGSTSAGGGRVTGRFTVPQRNQTENPAPAPNP